MQYFSDVIYFIRSLKPHFRLKKQLPRKYHRIIILLKVSISFKVLKLEIFFVIY